MVHAADGLRAELDSRAPLDPRAFGVVSIRRAAALTTFGFATRPNDSRPSDAYYVTAVASPTPDGAAGRIYALAQRGKVVAVRIKVSPDNRRGTRWNRPKDVLSSSLLCLM